MNMPQVAIVTDSGADLPKELIKEFSINVVPFLIQWNQETFRDLEDIQPGTFYERLEYDKTWPETKPPSANMFLAKYRELAAAGFDILSIHTSSDLTATIQSAREAKNALPEANIKIIDSKFIATALGFQVINTARAALQGASLEECRIVAEQSQLRTGLFFTVEQIKYLKKGGRMGSAAALISKTFQLKPIFNITDGKITPVDSVHSMKYAVEEMMELVKEKIGNQKPVRLCAMHGNRPEKALQLLNELTCLFNPCSISEAFCTTISPAVGIHTGPGCLGIAYMVGY